MPSSSRLRTHVVLARQITAYPFSALHGLSRNLLIPFNYVLARNIHVCLGLPPSTFENVVIDKTNEPSVADIWMVWLFRDVYYRDYIIDLVTCVEPELSQGRLTIAVFMDIKRAYDVMRTSDQVCYGARSTTAHGNGSSASSKENNILFSLLPVIAPNMPSSRVLRKGVYWVPYCLILLWYSFLVCC